MVFPHQEMASNISPHAVLCSGCLHAAVEEIDSDTEPLAGGEAIPGVIEEPTTRNDDYSGVPLDEDDSIPEV